jgi:hypothetical protein
MESKIKRMQAHEKKSFEEDEKRNKENMKVMAKIAFKEWKERKGEEGRHKKKQVAMEKKRAELEKQEMRMARRQMVNEMSRRRATGRPGGGNLILPAYGLNKNLKSLRQDKQGGRLRARSARPVR